MAAAWSAEELEHIGHAKELQIATLRHDGSLRTWTPIWVVVSDTQVYVRSWHRRNTGWFGDAITSGRARIRVPGLEADVVLEDLGRNDTCRQVDIDAAYRAKYGRSSARSMVSVQAAATTLRLIPSSLSTASTQT